MQRFPRIVALLVFLGLVLLAGPVLGQNRRDTLSPSGRYRVTDTSKEHSPTVENQFSSADCSFVCVDTITKQTLWAYHHKDEWGSGSEIFVSDDGWTVVCLYGSTLIPVDRAGREHGKIDLFAQFSKSERKHYVQDVMDAPDEWGEATLWSFLDVEGGSYFVVRPWWGHHVVIDLAAGKPARASRALNAAIASHERANVMAQLTKGVDTFKTWENDCCPPAAIPVCTAAYLAGVLHMPGTVPLLRQLEASTYSRRCGGSMADLEEIKQHEGEIDPGYSMDYTLRQIAQLSLRRLEQVPRPLSGVGLERKFVNYKRDRSFLPNPPAVPRAENVARIEIGQSPEQVVALLGGPDIIGQSGWEYDLDNDPAKTLTITWEHYKVVNFRFEKPAAWQQTGKREFELIY